MIQQRKTHFYSAAAGDEEQKCNGENQQVGKTKAPGHPALGGCSKESLFVTYDPAFVRNAGAVGSRRTVPGDQLQIRAGALVRGSDRRIHLKYTFLMYVGEHRAPGGNTHKPSETPCCPTRSRTKETTAEILIPKHQIEPHFKTTFTFSSFADDI